MLGQKKEIPVIEYLIGWAENRADDICKAQDVLGGWEDWAQIDIALWIEKKTGYMATRSPNVYKGRFQADLIISGDSHDVDTIIELKVYNPSEKAKDLVDKVLQDRAKLDNPMKSAFKTAIFFSIAVTRTGDMYSEDSIKIQQALKKEGYIGEYIQKNGYWIGVWGYRKG